MKKSALCLALGVVGIATGVSAWAQDAATNGVRVKQAIASQLSAKELSARKERLAQRIGNTIRTPGNTCAAATNEISALPLGPLARTTTGTVDELNVATGFAGAYDVTTPCTGGGTGGGGRGTVYSGTGTGEDEAFRIRTSAGCTLNIGMAPGAGLDMGVMVHSATSCDGVTDLVCVDDTGVAGGAEAVNLTAVAGTDYFVVVDGYLGDGGAYTFTITGGGCSLVPVELQSFQIN